MSDRQLFLGPATKDPFAISCALAGLESPCFPGNPNQRAQRFEAHRGVDPRATKALQGRDGAFARIAPSSAQERTRSSRGCVGSMAMRTRLRVSPFTTRLALSGSSTEAEASRSTGFSVRLSSMRSAARAAD